MSSSKLSNVVLVFCCAPLVFSGVAIAKTWRSKVESEVADDVARRAYAYVERNAASGNELTRVAEDERRTSEALAQRALQMSDAAREASVHGQKYSTRAVGARRSADAAADRTEDIAAEARARAERERLLQELPDHPPRPTTAPIARPGFRMTAPPTPLRVSPNWNAPY